MRGYALGRRHITYGLENTIESVFLFVFDKRDVLYGSHIAAQEAVVMGKLSRQQDYIDVFSLEVGYGALELGAAQKGLLFGHQLGHIRYEVLLLALALVFQSCQPS